MEEKKAIKTPYREKKEARELSVYEERKALMEKEGAMATAVDDLLMKKYGIYSRATIWSICARVEKRLEGGQ